MYIFLVKTIKVSTRLTSSSSTIIDHILASFPERFTQWGVIHIGMLDYQLIYCTRKTSWINRGSHKQIKFRLSKHYTVDLFKQELSKWNFLNYLNYNDIDKPYKDFTQKTMSDVYKVTPMKHWWVKQTSQE